MSTGTAEGEPHDVSAVDNGTKIRRLLAVAAAGCGAALLVAGGLTALPNPPLESIRILVDGSQRHQVMDGFGVEIDSSRWNGGELASALDLLVDDLGATLFRVTIDGDVWETTNDNSDPSTFDWGYHGGSSASARAEALWSTLDHLNQRGVTSGIVLALRGRVPTWMGGTRVDVSAEEEWVEMVASLVHYARVNRNLQFSRLSPLDEPDGDGRRGPRVDELQTVRLLRKLARRLKADGLGDVRLVAPRTTSARIALQRYIPRLLADRVLMAHMEAFTLDGDAGFVSEVEALIGTSVGARRKLWLSERSPADAAALDAVTGLLERLRDDAVTGAIFDGRGRPGDDSRLAGATPFPPCPTSQRLTAMAQARLSLRSPSSVASSAPVRSGSTRPRRARHCLWSPSSIPQADGLPSLAGTPPAAAVPSPARSPGCRR